MVGSGYLCSVAFNIFIAKLLFIFKKGMYRTNFFVVEVPKNRQIVYLIVCAFKFTFSAIVFSSI